MNRVGNRAGAGRAVWLAAGAVLFWCLNTASFAQTDPGRPLSETWALRNDLRATWHGGKLAEQRRRLADQLIHLQRIRWQLQRQTQRIRDLQWRLVTQRQRALWRTQGQGGSGYSIASPDPTLIARNERNWQSDDYQHTRYYRDVISPLDDIRDIRDVLRDPLADARDYSGQFARAVTAIYAESAELLISLLGISKASSMIPWQSRDATRIASVLVAERAYLGLDPLIEANIRKSFARMRPGVWMLKQPWNVLEIIEDATTLTIDKMANKWLQASQRSPSRDLLEESFRENRSQDL